MINTNYGILCIRFKTDIENSPREEEEHNFNFHNNMCYVTFLSKNTYTSTLFL